MHTPRGGLQKALNEDLTPALDAYEEIMDAIQSASSPSALVAIKISHRQEIDLLKNHPNQTGYLWSKNSYNQRMNLLLQRNK